MNVVERPLPVCDWRHKSPAAGEAILPLALAPSPRRGWLVAICPPFLPLYSSPRVELEAVMRTMLARSEEHTSELQSHLNLVCRLLLEKKKQSSSTPPP